MDATFEFDRQLLELASRASELAERDRDPFLEQQCPDNPDMLEAVRRLLICRADLEAHRFLLQVGCYRITSKLGGGGMGSVFAAVDIRNGQEVAVKLIEGEPGAKNAAQHKERWTGEVHALARLGDPHIVKLLDFGTEGDQPFVVMELVDGPTLDELLGGPEDIDRDRALEILEQTATALDYAHQKGVVHRDLKPANLMLSGNIVKITDFGIAKLTFKPGITRLGTRMGTPGWMSPEQIQGSEVTGRSDQFVLGLLAFRMLTGKPVIQIHEWEDRILSGAMPSAHAANPALPSFVDQVFFRAWAKRPEDRYPTCAAFAGELREALIGEPSWSRTRYREFAALVAAPARALAGRPAALLAASLIALALLAQIVTHWTDGIHGWSISRETLAAVSGRPALGKPMGSPRLYCAWFNVFDGGRILLLTHPRFGSAEVDFERGLFLQELLDHPKRWYDSHEDNLIPLRKDDQGVIEQRLRESGAKMRDTAAKTGLFPVPAPLPDPSKTFAGIKDWSKGPLDGGIAELYVRYGVHNFLGSPHEAQTCVTEVILNTYENGYVVGGAPGESCGDVSRILILLRDGPSEQGTWSETSATPIFGSVFRTETPCRL